MTETPLRERLVRKWLNRSCNLHERRNAYWSVQSLFQYELLLLHRWGIERLACNEYI